MRAAVLQSPQTVDVRELPADEPGPGEVRVLVHGAGICASELPLWQGREWFDYPRQPGEPGHEGWGRVESLGDDAEAVRRGDRVAFISSRAHRELEVVPATQLVALPDEIPEDQPFPGEPLACAVNAFRRSAVTGGERVAIVGGGFFGMLLVQLCAGVAGEVEVVSRRRPALELARRLGATRTWLAGDGEAERQELFDVVFEVTGHQQPLDLAARLTRVRGRLVIVGYHQDGLRTVDMQLWNWRGLDVVNAHERDPAAYVEGLRHAVQAVVEGRLDPSPLITHRFPLARIGEAYRVSSERPDGFVKAVWELD